MKESTWSEELPDLAGVPPRDDSGWPQLAMQFGRIVVYSCDVATGIALRSENSMEIMGLPASGPTQHWSDCIIPDDLPFFENALKSVTPQSPMFEVEYRIRHPVSGNVFWVLDRGEGEFDESGERLHVRGAIVDISGRIRAEHKLREEVRLRSVAFEAAHMGAWRIDVTSGMLTCSDELLALLKIGREQFDSTPQAIERIIHPADAELWRKAYENALTEGGKLEIEFRAMLPPGVIRWFVSRGQTLREPGGRAIESYGVMFDITQRKFAEEDAARLAAIVTSSEDAIISNSLTGIVTSWNRGAERLLGYNAEEMIGQPVSRIIPQDLAAEAFTTLGRVGRGEAIDPYESVRLRKDGGRIHVSLTVSPIRSAAGQVSGSSTIARDITERRNWDQRQAMLLRELSHRVKNTMAVVQSMTRQTLRTTSDPKAFAEAFEGRIRSLAAAHTLLTDNEWRGAMLADVIRIQLGGIVDDMAKRFTLRGPGVLLPAEAATQLGLVLHELGTNAAKHGALSKPGGTIAVGWTASGGKLRLAWRERGGPRIDAAPSHKGFGTVLIDSSAVTVSRRFDPAGLTCRLDISL